MTKEEVLERCTVNGKILYLPDYQLDRKLYQQVAKQLELMGGKWNRKEKGFVFDNDPTPLLKKVRDGEVVNPKKEFQFFETPPWLAENMVHLAFKEPCNLGKVLEPSAGHGNIMKAILKYDPDIAIHWCELNEINKSIVDRLEYFTYFEGYDFLQIDKPEEFSIIIANPPWNKNQDIDHVYKMYECLEPGGRMVVLTSVHWENSSNKKETAFREWLGQKNVYKEKLPQGTFKESGTMVGGFLLIINKE